MTVVVIDPPDPVVDLDLLRRHIPDLPEEDEEYAQMLAQAATAWLDGPDGWLGRAIGTQTLEWRLADWPCAGFRLPYPPEIEIIAISYVDVDGAEQDWPVPDALYVGGLPPVRGRAGDVRIQYRAGYERDVPAPIKASILMLTAQWYRKREASTVGETMAEPPFGVSRLLWKYRVFA